MVRSWGIRRFLSCLLLGRCLEWSLVSFLEVPIRYLREFSGGQRQRLIVAHVLELNPKLIVVDEPLCALDMSIQAHVLNPLGGYPGDLGPRSSLRLPRHGGRSSPHVAAPASAGPRPQLLRPALSPDPTRRGPLSGTLSLPPARRRNSPARCVRASACR